MRILQLDVNRIFYELVKPEASVYEESKEKRVEVKDALVLLVSVEKGDTEEVAMKAIDDAVAFASKIKRKKIVLYPFAHLSNNLEEPSAAAAIFSKMKEAALSKGMEVYAAPFGWNKSLQLDVKGYPLAEQSRSYDAASIAEVRKNAAPKKKEEKEHRTINTGIEESAALKEEEKVKSSWYILDSSGSLTPVEKFDFKGHENLRKFARYEMEKVRSYQQMPAHIKLMQRLQLVDYEPGSDAGNMRYYPNGRLIKSLLERFVTSKVISYGSVEVETPLMYDYGHKALKDYLNRFPARHYVVRSDDKEYFLRFSADFGQFLLMSDATVSYKQLPFRFYELTRYSFRREKSGELVGLKRLRSFTMPDMHTLCKDVEQAKGEFMNQFKFSKQMLASIGIESSDYETAVRATEGFWNDNKDFIINLAKENGKPMLLELWNYRYAYFDPKFEFNIVDSMDKAAALSTVQMDHENGKRYEITYIDSDGSEKYPIILHCSPSGAIERVIYAFLELAYMKEKEGKVPSFPLWLTPTQVRLLPISDKHVEKAVELAEKLKSHEIRVDVDDTEATLEKKVRNAEQEWIPYICVVGDKEASSGKLSVRIREEKAQRQMALDDLAALIEEKTKGMPKAELSLNMLLSKRPIFFG